VQECEHLLASRSQISEIRSLLSQFDTLFLSPRYISRSDLAPWVETAQGMCARLPLASTVFPFTLLHGGLVKRFVKTVRGCFRLLDARNDHFVYERLGAPVLDSISRTPLTDEQRRAVLHDEDVVLVIAGAGTGKTTTLLAKAAYLVLQERIPPDQILILSFLVKVREELRARLQQLHAPGIEDLPVHNLHSFANELIARVEGKKASVSRLAKDEARSEFVQAALDTMLGGQCAQSVLGFAIHDMPSVAPLGASETETYWSEWRIQRRRSLSGHYVRSLEELRIADYLFCMGVRFEYEAKYRPADSLPAPGDGNRQEYRRDLYLPATSDEYRREYKPDFYLPDYDIYIEHFALDEDGKAPPIFSPAERARYESQYRWKVQLHEKHSTRSRLVCTYSFQARQGILLRVLREQLDAHNVHIAPRSPEELRNHPSVKPQISALSNLISDVLEHYRSGRWTEERLLARARESGQLERAERFLAIFRGILTAYEADLISRDEVDFSDMLHRASSYLETGTLTIACSHLLVDEFQDIDGAIARFLKALRSSAPGAKLFCIGDDWQAIYRFRGGDVGFISHFEESFGHPKKLNITQTFRFDSRLEEITSRFIQRNVRQLPKTLKCRRTDDRVPIRILLADVGRDPTAGYRDAIRRALREIANEGSVMHPSVLVLSRYNWLKDQLRSGSTLLGRDFPAMDIAYSTIHGAKGLESDYVIIVGMQGGASGYTFPSSTSDDPMLDMLLEASDSFPHAEERRLFYVAMTRSRNRVFAIAPSDHISSFVLELLEGRTGIECLDQISSLELPRCPVCHRGFVVLHPGVDAKPSWWECELCGARPRLGVCPTCGTKAITLHRSKLPPHASACGHCGGRT
jgi:DNA helicase-4